MKRYLCGAIIFVLCFVTAFGQSGTTVGLALGTWPGKTFTTYESNPSVRTPLGTTLQNVRFAGVRVGYEFATNRSRGFGLALEPSIEGGRLWTQNDPVYGDNPAGWYARVEAVAKLRFGGFVPFAGMGFQYSAWQQRRAQVATFWDPCGCLPPQSFVQQVWRQQPTTPDTYWSAVVGAEVLLGEHFRVGLTARVRPLFFIQAPGTAETNEPHQFALMVGYKFSR